MNVILTPILLRFSGSVENIVFSIKGKTHIGGRDSACSLPLPPLALWDENVLPFRELSQLGLP
jgi:hypothetical protein